MDISKMTGKTSAAQDNGALNAASTTNECVTKEYAALLCRFKEGDVEAFRVIYEKWRKPVFLFLRKMLASEDDAHDITQDVFSMLWEMREKIDTSKDIKALIFLLARRTTTSYLRKLRSHDQYLAEQEYEVEYSKDSEDVIIEKEIELLMLYTLERMSETQRRVFEMSFYKGMSNAEIAEALQLSNGSVRVHLHEARKSIKNIILTLCAVIFLSLL